MSRTSTKTEIISDVPDDEIGEDDLEEPVELPPSASYGNFKRVGQSYYGKVINFSPDGGADMNEAPCPELKLELLKPAIVILNDDEVEVAAGEELTITAGQVLLAKRLLQANPQTDQRIKITFTGMRGRAKDFEVRPGPRPILF